MPRNPTTPAQARAKADAHIANMRRAIATLSAPLSDTDVCYCDAGSAAGITERECGCQYAEAVLLLDAGACYVRRSVRGGLI